MKLTTLCYITNENKWLMLHRTKKQNDSNEGKWIGVGGKLENGESPDDCIYREVYEETGLILTSYQFRGIITFCSDIWDDEIMFLYTSSDFTGNIKPCDEGDLSWIEENKILSLNLWEGDRIFIDLILKNHPFFSLKLQYSGDKLISAILDGKCAFSNE